MADEGINAQLQNVSTTSPFYPLSRLGVVGGSSPGAEQGGSGDIPLARSRMGSQGSEGGLASGFCFRRADPSSRVSLTMSRFGRESRRNDRDLFMHELEDADDPSWALTRR